MSGRLTLSLDVDMRGGVLAKLTVKEKLFVVEYLARCNAKEAAIRAGYSPKTAKVQGAKLLKKPLIEHAIYNLSGKISKKYELERDEILQQLAYCATRSGADFVDSDGKLVENVLELPERAQQAIDGIKQRVKRYTDPTTGELVEEVQTELKLVGKASAIRMAMEHKGLFAPVLHDHKVSIDFHDLVEKLDSQENVVEGKVQKALEQKPSRNGNGSVK